MITARFLGRVISCDKNEIVVIIPGTELIFRLPRKKLKNIKIEIGGEVFVKPTKTGYDLSYMFKPISTDQLEILGQIGDQYLKHLSDK